MSGAKNAKKSEGGEGMAKQVIYDQNGKVLSYDYNLRTFVFFDKSANSQKELTVEELASLIQREGRLSTGSTDVRTLLSLSRKFKKNGKNGGNNVRKAILSLKNKPLIRVNDSTKEFSIRGIEALVRKQVKSQDVNTVVDRVLYVLYEEYFKNGDIPNLATVKKIVRQLTSSPGKQNVSSENRRAQSKNFANSAAI